MKPTIIDIIIDTMVDVGDLKRQSYPDGPTMYEDNGGGIYTEPDDEVKKIIASNWVRYLDPKDVRFLITELIKKGGSNGG